MHLLLVIFFIFTWMTILESEEKAIKFLTEIDLVPSRDDKIKCVNCSDEMASWTCSVRKIGFQFICKNYRKEKNSYKTTLDALENTFLRVLEFHFVIF